MITDTQSQESFHIESQKSYQGNNPYANSALDRSPYEVRMLYIQYGVRDYFDEKLNSVLGIGGTNNENYALVALSLSNNWSQGGLSSRSLGEAYLQKFNRYLDEYNMERLQYFFNLPPGWDGYNAEPLTITVLDNFWNFLRQYGEISSLMSLFLHPSGNLEILWEDMNGSEVEISFGKDSIEYYIEKSEMEGVEGVGDSDIGRLAQKILN